jgi:DNA polymerase III subunit delta'
LPGRSKKRFAFMPFSKEVALERLNEARRAGRLAHAYLLTGPVGSGKSWLADRMAALLLECAPESVIAHPDLHVVQPESKSRRIVIDQIRELERAIQRKPLLASSKVAIIHDAERMQPQAANAFLKTLEEPPSGSLIVLLSTVPEAILQTVLSRCVETALRPETKQKPTPEEQAILSALKECLISEERPGPAAAFRLARAVQDILSEIREKISSEHEDLLRKETTRYKQASDDSAWFEERAGQVKALVEAGALRERERVLQAIFEAIAGALRAQHGLPVQNPVVAALSRKFSAKELLRSLDTLELLRRRLALGVQESLAFESGFLEMITVHESSHSATFER